MRLDHIAICVSDLEQAKEQFVTRFGARANEKYHNPKTGLSTYFLTFDGNARLELLHYEDREITPGGGHVALGVGSREKVDQLTAQLRSDGWKLVSGPRVTGDGCYESCFLDEDGNIIEITV